VGISSFAELSRGQRIFALTGMMITFLTSTMYQAMSTIAMPRAIASLNGFAHYAWPSTAFGLTTAVSIPVIAKLSDLYGRKGLYLSCTALYVLSLLGCAASGALPIPLDGMNQLVVFRGLVGIANGGITAISYTLVADISPPQSAGATWGFWRPRGALPCFWDQALAAG